MSKLHFVGTDKERYPLEKPFKFLCGSAPIETPGCAGGDGYSAPPPECGGDVSHPRPALVVGSWDMALASAATHPLLRLYRLALAAA